MKKRFFSLGLVAVMSLSLVLSGCGKKADTDQGQGTQVETNDKISGGGQKDSNDVSKVDSDQNAENPAKARSNSDNTIVLGITEAKGEFSPVYYSSSYDGFVVDLVYRSLIVMGKDGEYKNDLIDTYEISEDGTTYTLKLKQGVTFSNGNPLTAKDVEFTYLTIADPNYDGRYTSQIQDVVGYEEYHNEGLDSEGNRPEGYEYKVDSISGMKVIDDYTISFTFKEAMRTNFSSFKMGILSKADFGFAKGNVAEYKAKKSDAIGAGPYTIAKFEPKQYVKLTKNPNYQGEGYEIENVIFKFTEQSTEMEELQSGAVDILPGQIYPENIETAKEAGFVDLVQYPRSGYGYLKFNSVSPMVSDYRVRQALQYAYDGEQFVQLKFQGLAVTQDVPMSQVSWAYTEELQNELIHYGYNPEKAKELLDEAGWKVGADGIREKDGQKLVLKIPAMPDHGVLDILVPLLIQQWEAVGAKVEVSYMDFNSLLDLVYYGDRTSTDWDLFFLASSITSGDPDQYTTWHSKFNVEGGDNTARFMDEKNDELLEKGRKEFDIEKAKGIYKEWALNINEKSPIIIVYSNLYTDMVNNRVQGFETNALYNVSQALKDAKIVQ